MDEAELRRKFDREVSAPDKEMLWEWLEEDHYVSDVCSGDSGWEEFEAEADRLANRQRRMLGRTKPPGRRPQFYSIEVELNEHEKEHAAALSPYLGKRAALLPEVCDFRRKKLGGSVLRPEAVVEFIRSELGGRLSSKDDMDLASELQYAATGPFPDIEELKDLVGGWMHRSRASHSRHEYKVLSRALESDSLAMLDEPIDIYATGAMDLIHGENGQTLRDLGRWLCSLYPWPLRDAAWFVLTDEPPEVEPLKIHRNASSGAFRLIFEPWISEETIRRAYRSVQLGDNRPLETKSLAAFRFVTAYAEPGEKPRWAELTRRWNERFPNHKYTDRSALRRAYKGAEERLAVPWMLEEEELESR